MSEAIIFELSQSLIAKAPKSWEQYIDIMVGLFVGTYTQYAGYQRGSCHDSLTSFAISIAGYNKDLDKPFLDKDGFGWFVWVLGPPFDLVSLYNLTENCLFETDFNKAMIASKTG